MNANIKLCVLTLILSGVSNIKAQQAKNSIKVNLLHLISNTYSIEYERQLTNKLSIGTAFSTMPEGKIPFTSLLEKGDKYFERSKLGAFSFSPELRYYGKGDGIKKGFYIGPYFKYSNYTFDSYLEFSSQGVKEELPITGTIKGYTAGLTLGNNYNLGKNIILDWRIFGPGYGVSKGKITGTTSQTLTQSQQNELKNELNKLTSEVKIIEATNTVSANSVESNLKGPWANIRTALSIGYRF